MKTILTKYSFNTDNADEAVAWKALKAELRATPGRGHCHDIWNGGCGAYDKRKALPDGEIMLEDVHLFENQWNTAGIDGHNGWRVFDWTINRVDNRKIKTGHYLEITEEMVEARRSRYACGYCGHQTVEPELIFCDQCRGSEYQEEDNLKLLRLRPVCEDTPRNSRPDLTTEEKAALLPSFKEAKKAQRLAAFHQRQDTAEKKARQAVIDAETEEKATLWLIQHDVEPDLFIFYSHTQRFCFGWRAPLGPDAKADLIGKLGSEFPFDYDIKQTEEARLA